ncbi:GP37/P34.8, Spindlin, Fusolin, Spheroidin-like protein [Perigonia lusca single nucleopolyhedrovirus]|uniref:GP37/P34.8, Spindlin, Fusolin, Spheroidin-like protein n=1 Tax=Perigonia lusca single nucleopolyhedrovirus TaxID=1675865 RepID=A0A0M3WNH3_9ABAC|nr:GP37/P34.8, Spindlin, Fusolin, Spheroidin-like protein [Perigonia lusca single nucleopolyhedrovirus]AKN80640.1 GP37/P34.8, Spindlin, Fusolin, Spheroidin-like protein [Perigonia lusca single nucleopolyhedrovirus]
MISKSIMTSLFLLVYCSVFVFGHVHGHGYLSFPAARQYKCFRDDNFWWPDTGDSIPDEACRAAYQAVYAKYRSMGENHGVAANAAQYMFQQYHEYAATAGAQYNDLNHIQSNVVPSSLCAAGATQRWDTFGDKSGMDIAVPNWRADVLYTNNKWPVVDDAQHKLANRKRHHKSLSSTDDDKLKDQNFVSVDIHFCPTTIHEPSYFQVFISKPTYNYSAELTWGDLELLTPLIPNNKDNDNNDSHSNLIANDGLDDLCTNSMIYVIPTEIPYRANKFVLFVRWQRDDPSGEGFYNCADVMFDHTNYLPTKYSQHDEL